MKNKVPAVPDTSFLTGLKFNNWNGCRECDTQTRLDNLKLAPLDDDMTTFVNWLNSLGDNECYWWRAIGWSEGFRYFNSANAGGQLFYLDSLRKDKSERLPHMIQLEKELAES